MNNEFESHTWPFQNNTNEASEKSSGENVTSDLLKLKNCSLVDYINENPKSADLKWSLFCAACNSYRFDSVLKPFPPFFLKEENNKQIERLREVVQLCPPMTALSKDLRENTLSTTLLDLLYWVLIHLSEPYFKFIPKDEHQSIFSQVSSSISAAMPDYIFSVTYGTRHQQKFAFTASNRSTKLAFHGSRLDNFYSIVNYGLQVSLNKVAAFGPGIYLSSEMGISLPYSPRGYTWSSSIFGSHISIVAICEIIDHPEVRSERDSKSPFDSEHQPGTGKYLIVGNSDLVRIKYLLVYTSDEFESASLMESSTLLGWIRRHKMFTFVAAYVILLLGIGSSNSTLIYKYYRRLLRKFGAMTN